MSRGIPRRRYNDLWFIACCISARSYLRFFHSLPLEKGGTRLLNKYRETVDEEAAQFATIESCQRIFNVNGTLLAQLVLEEVFREIVAEN